eukprot:gb/GFBE01079149.1/.p1 GENE.gb/GFBE01079149.1/~~gb/GFBE01079149.1/.p1  ORF type:complete len:168 (+),score=35.24 gb/GFBE01079149.1/:1-504(+)
MQTGFAAGNKVRSTQDWTGVRVVMLQNIPCRCQQSEIVDIVREFGFEESVEYIRLPHKSHKNAGYAFVGFSRPEAAVKFRDVVHGYCIKSRTSNKKIKALPAHVQDVPDEKLFPKGFPSSLAAPGTGAALAKCYDVNVNGSITIHDAVSDMSYQPPMTWTVLARMSL